MRKQEPRARLRGHLDRQIEEVAHDPYLERSKPHEPAVCPQCGLVHHKGRWQRIPHPASAEEHLCPACHRTKDHYPAGYVTVSGDLAGMHKQEILRLIRNEEAHEAGDHPLQRIMDVEEKSGVITITTTGVQLARRIGEALYRAYHGKLQLKYSQDEYLVRVTWEP